ncbi:unnamed protein product [Closterium sp. Naga37s-1]|nr:unnamed protein product [Closterium sp. Naga37s-1]
MVRLTADLILESPQYFNAVREREIDLRGNKIAVIENLGATEDLFDSIDLSDNEIVKLEGFPLLRRLSTLLLCNNRITRINPQLGTQLPKLQTLVLANNRLTNLADLDPLASLAHSLTSLSLLDNTVVKKPKYRLYAIHLLPKLRLLDFRKVKLKERQEAEATFGKDRAAAAAAKRVSANTFVPGEALAEAGGGAEGAAAAGGAGDGGKEGGEGAAAAAAAAKGPTPEQITAIKVITSSTHFKRLKSFPYCAPVPPAAPALPAPSATPALPAPSAAPALHAPAAPPAGCNQHGSDIGRGPAVGSIAIRHQVGSTPPPFLSPSPSLPLLSLSPSPLPLSLSAPSLLSFPPSLPPSLSSSLPLSLYSVNA